MASERGRVSICVKGDTPRLDQRLFKTTKNAAGKITPLGIFDESQVERLENHWLETIFPFGF